MAKSITAWQGQIQSTSCPALCNSPHIYPLLGTQSSGVPTKPAINGASRAAPPCTNQAGTMQPAKYLDRSPPGQGRSFPRPRQGPGDEVTARSWQWISSSFPRRRVFPRLSLSSFQLTVLIPEFESSKPQRGTEEEY